MISKLHSLIIIGCLIVLSNVAYSQNIKLRGLIKDSLSAVPYATIQINQLKTSGDAKREVRSFFTRRPAVTAQSICYRLCNFINNANTADERYGYHTHA